MIEWLCKVFAFVAITITELSIIALMVFIINLLHSSGNFWMQLVISFLCLAVMEYLVNNWKFGVKIIKELPCK